MSDMYFRDLSENLQHEVRQEILKNRPDLVEPLNEEEDIVVGQFRQYTFKNYRLA